MSFPPSEDDSGSLLFSCFYKSDFIFLFCNLFGKIVHLVSALAFTDLSIPLKSQNSLPLSTVIVLNFSLNFIPYFFSSLSIIYYGPTSAQYSFCKLNHCSEVSLFLLQFSFYSSNTLYDAGNYLLTTSEL